MKAVIKILPSYGGNPDTGMIEVREVASNMGGMARALFGSTLITCEVYHTNISGSFAAARDNIRLFVQQNNIEILDAPMGFRDLM